MVGGVVSTRVMLWLAVPLVLAQLSCARQLRVVTSAQLLPEVVSPKLSTVAPLQVSLAVGAVKLGMVVPHSKVSAAPASPMSGAVVSTRVIIWVTVPLVLPQLSCACQLRVVTNAQLVPEVVSPRLSTVAPLQVSLAVGAVKLGIVVPHSKVCAAPAGPMSGPMVSSRVMLWVTVPLVLPQLSCACQLRIVTNAQLLPEVVSPRLSTVAPLQVSEAVGAVKLGMVVPHSKVCAAPAVPMVGAVVSSCVMLWVTVPLVLPQLSCACQLRVVTNAQLLPDVVSPKLSTVAPLQVSLAVGAVKLGIVVPHSKVCAAPAGPMSGPMVSSRVMLWVTVPLVLPQLSCACQLRVVTNAQLLPEVVSPRLSTVAPLHVSEAVGAVKLGIVVPHSKV